MSPLALTRSLELQLLATRAETNLIGPLECPSFASPFQTLSMGSVPHGYMR